MECLSRIPYTTVIGFLLIVIGAAISGATVYDSMNRMDKLFQKYFFKFSYMNSILLSSIIFILVLLIVSFFILVFALVITGATRHKIYRHNRCLFGGRRTAGFMMMVLFFANISWIGVMCINVIPVLGWLMLGTYCRKELSYYDLKKSLRVNFTLSNYGFYTDSWFTSDASVKTYIDNVKDFRDFCSDINTIGPLFTCSLIGCFLVIFGLITSIASLSSLYMRLKYTKQLTGLMVAYEDQKANELDYIVNSKAM